MSELLRSSCAEARRGNSTNKQQVRDIGNTFLNIVEISAQEAVYVVLQLPMRKSSRQVVFINTAPPEDRVHILKPMNDINELDDDSEEIYSTGLLKRYSTRPTSLEHVSLAGWAAWYDSCDKPFVRKSHELDTDNLPLEKNIDNDGYGNDGDDDLHENDAETEKCLKSSGNKKR